jgi:hypothetical protein
MSLNIQFLRFVLQLWHGGKDRADVPRRKEPAATDLAIYVGVP